MPNISGLIKRIEQQVAEALMPTYTLDIIIKPDDPRAVTEFTMYDDVGNLRVLIGKLASDYGIWISRKGYDVNDQLDIKYLSFTGSLLTPKLRAGAVVPMDLTIDNSPTDRTWERNSGSPSLGIQINKDYPDEKLTLIGFYRLNKSDGSVLRVPINSAKDCSSFFTVLHDYVTDIYFEFYLTTDSIYSSVDIEYWVFSDK